MSFADVRYQDPAVRLLRAAVASDRVPHAYLFVGPRGVGKGLAAREFAKLLLCEKPRGTAEKPDPCDQCTHCTRIDRGVHPDLYWFRKEADRNDFRISMVVRRQGEESASPQVTVTESVVLYPMEARRTVTVVDDAEQMNDAAANALLKTLEEPSPHAVLILVCSDATQLPSTIRSRCQWVKFNPLPDEFVAEKMKAIVAAAGAAPARGKQEEPPRKMSADEIAFICRFAGGSIEQAVQLAGSGLWNLKRQLVAGLPEMDEASALDLAEMIAEWGRAEVRRLHVKLDSPEGNTVRRQSARTALAAVASAFRDALVRAAGAAGDVRSVNADQPQSVEMLAAWPAESCGRAVALLADAQAQIARYVHIDLATENALVQVSRLGPAGARLS